MTKVVIAGKVTNSSGRVLSWSPIQSYKLSPMSTYFKLSSPANASPRIGPSDQYVKATSKYSNAVKVFKAVGIPLASQELDPANNCVSGRSETQSNRRVRPPAIRNCHGRPATPSIPPNDPTLGGMVPNNSLLGRQIPTSDPIVGIFQHSHSQTKNRRLLHDAIMSSRQISLWHVTLYHEQ